MTGRCVRSGRSPTATGACCRSAGLRKWWTPVAENSPWDDLEQWGRERFGARPALYRWSTHDYSSADGIPLIGLVDEANPNVQVATGFGGWGMSTAGVAAQLFRESISEGQHQWHSLFDPHRDIPVADSRVVSSRSTSGRDVDASQELDRLSPGCATIVTTKASRLPHTVNQAVPYIGYRQCARTSAGSSCGTGRSASGNAPAMDPGSGQMEQSCRALLATRFLSDEQLAAVPRGKPGKGRDVVPGVRPAVHRARGHGHRHAFVEAGRSGRVGSLHQLCDPTAHTFQWWLETDWP